MRILGKLPLEISEAVFSHWLVHESLQSAPEWLELVAVGVAVIVFWTVHQGLHRHGPVQRKGQERRRKLSISWGPDGVKFSLFSSGEAPRARSEKPSSAKDQKNSSRHTRPTK